MRKKCCYGQKNLGQYSSLSPSPTHLSHTRNITLSRIKCERYIFIKKRIRSFIEVRILSVDCFRIFVYVYVQLYCGYTTLLLHPQICVATRPLCHNHLHLKLQSTPFSDRTKSDNKHFILLNVLLHSLIQHHFLFLLNNLFNGALNSCILGIYKL